MDRSSRAHKEGEGLIAPRTGALHELLTLTGKTALQPRRTVRVAMDRVREALFWDRLYEAMREPKARGPVPHDPAAQRRIADELKWRGVEVAPMELDPGDIAGFRADAEYDQRLAYRGADQPEKVLEHYVAAKLLGLGPSDVVLDIASQRSPAPAIYRRLYGCRVYRQDLELPAGVHGELIGSDAADLPLPDGFATALTLHNAFEHFEGDSDVRFIREAGRVLRPGGRMCIVPLFLHETYAIQCDPIRLAAGGPSLERDAVAWCARGWGDRHGRFYDVPHFLSRIHANLGPLRMRILVLENAAKIHPACYARFVALFEKP